MNSKFVINSIRITGSQKKKKNNNKQNFRFVQEIKHFSKNKVGIIILSKLISKITTKEKICQESGEDKQI